MRIIAGQFRRRTLLTNPGLTTRPIIDRAKVMLFDHIRHRMPGSKVLDIYSGTVAALRGLQGQSQLYLPAISFYLDDVGSYFSNEACGELAAVAEHNKANPMRPIFQDHSLPGRRSLVFEPWYKHMYVCHLLDHAYRNRPRDRGALSLDDHMAFMAALK